jgi:hypothetical protein
VAQYGERLAGFGVNADGVTRPNGELNETVIGDPERHYQRFWFVARRCDGLACTSTLEESRAAGERRCRRLAQPCTRGCVAQQGCSFALHVSPKPDGKTH